MIFRTDKSTVIFFPSNEKCTNKEKCRLVSVILDLDSAMIRHLKWLLFPIHAAKLQFLLLSWFRLLCWGMSLQTRCWYQFLVFCNGTITHLLSCVCFSIINQTLYVCMWDKPIIYLPVCVVNQKSFHHSSANLHLYNSKSLPWFGIIPHRLAPLFIPLRLILL